MNIDLNFNIKEYLDKYTPEKINEMRNELNKFKKNNLVRLETTDICLCQSNRDLKNNIKCNKNAIYKYNKNLLCWYHALLINKG